MHSILVPVALICIHFSFLPLTQGATATFDLNSAGAKLGTQGTLWSNPNNRIDAGGFVSKPFNSNPPTFGGNLGYQHNPSGSGLNLGVQKTPHFGTDVSATGTGNLWRNGNSRLDAVGSYSRHFGGPYGAGRPQYYGGLQFGTRF